MYTVKAENFSLELIPGKDNVSVEVYNDGFSGRCCFDSEDFLIADFVMQLKEMYEKLQGEAILQDLYETDGYIKFTATQSGHILISGKIINNRNRLTQQLMFEYDTDQSYLNEFVIQLANDYLKCID